MHPQLDQVAKDFESARERLNRLAGTVPAARWAERPAQGGWSVAECIAHLNLTSDAYLPRLREAVARGRAEGGAAPARYRQDFLGWLIWRAVRPQTKMKSKTSAAFVPTSTVPAKEMVAEFSRLQDEQIALTRQADGLPLGKLKIVSPFGPGIRYNVYSALTILAAHQLRHLDQAERAWQSLAAR